MEKITIAHIFQQNGNNSQWEIQTNDEHCQGVGELCSFFASPIGLACWGKILGIMHDRGKEKNDFQTYIRIVTGFEPNAGKYIDKSHSIIGASIIEKKIGNTFYILSNCIAGHHRGLYDHDTLQMELKKAVIPPEVSWNIPTISLEQFSKPLSTVAELSHLTRVLFSCLVDADFLDTEKFMNPQRSSWRNRSSDLCLLRQKIELHLNSLATLSLSNLNKLRTDIQAKSIEAGQKNTGFFELTVPTGGGKTLASVAWALSHAIKHDKHHIIIAIPFTSIIVQTAQVLRNIFGDDAVLEHHSVISEDNFSNANKLASENWDAPIIVTTNVQLFESIFSNHPAKCRKLHSLADSVVILDEPQSLPLIMMQPIINAMKSYNKLFGTSFLFCTASQPTLSGERKGLGIAELHGIEEGEIYPIIPKALQLHDKLRRVSISFIDDIKTIEDVAARVMDASRCLCIVNTRRLALELYNKLPHDECNMHLSRMMCPAHIAEKLSQIKEILSKQDCPIRVVSTQLIEAGVDIDFPIVIRQMSGLDSILQAAGRCNREGILKEGHTYVFDLQGQCLRGAMEKAANAMREMRSLYPNADWLDPQVMAEYYRLLYSKTDTFDKKEIETFCQKPTQISYQEISERFKLIEEDGIPVIVNYGMAPILIEQLKAEGPSRMLMRKLSLYTVTLRHQHFSELLSSGIISEIFKGIFYIEYKDQYDPNIGLRTDNKYLDQIFII